METTTTTEAVQPAAAPAAEQDAGDLDSRAAALFDQIATDQKATARDAAHPADAPAKEAPAEAPAEAAEEPSADPVADARRARIAERKAELQKLAEEERAKVAASRARKQAAPADEPPAQQGIQITDAASFFQAAEKLAIPPQDLAAWLTGQQDPSKVAEASAKKALSPVEQKLRELEERQAAWEEQQRRAAETAQVRALVEQNHQILANHLESIASEAPLSAAFSKRAPAKFRAAVESVCDQLPPGFTAQDVIDQIEEELVSMRDALQLQGAPAESSARSTAKAPPAAVKANVGNRLAAERATTVEDDGDDAGDDLETRAQRLKARLLAAG